MIVDVVMPQQGLTITEATLIRWAKQPGDPVRADELLFEVETDKAVVEVESPADGRLLACVAAEGDVVPFGQVVAKIGTEATDTAEDAAPSQDAAPGEAAAPRGVTEEVTEPPILTPQESQVLHNGQVPQGQEPVAVLPVASPRAKRAAAQMGVDLLLVQATGRRGKHIRERDVLLAAEQNALQSAERTGAQEAILPRETLPLPLREVMPLPRLRRITAQRTAASFRDVPHFYLTREISAARLLQFRAEIVGEVETQTGVRLTVTDFLLRALAAALMAFPAVNAQWSGEGVAPLGAVDVGLAVDTPDGLLVPVIRGADALSLTGIALRRAELVERARGGRSRPEDLDGGSFTLSNLGAFGVDQLDAIINSPQSGILSAGAIKPRPYVVDGVLAAVNTLILTVSMDHRVVDGAEAAGFLSRVADLLENPALLCAL